VVRVSIHAPAWGATKIADVVSLTPGVFQSTRPRGARRYFSGNIETDGKFQSTRPRGARHDSIDDSLEYIRGFNPRARVGRD